jgi:hypothetical protein
MVSYKPSSDSEITELYSITVILHLLLLLSILHATCHHSIENRESKHETELYIQSINVMVTATQSLEEGEEKRQGTSDRHAFQKPLMRQ